jgi:phage recombination protein Bet
MTMADTKTKTKTAERVADQAQPIARLAPSRLPIVGSLAKEFDVTPDQWRVLIDQIFPSAKSVEAIGMALAYCRARKLDIYKRVVHIVPMWSSVLGREVETVWPGIAEIRTTAHRTGNYAGIDPIKWGPMVTTTFKDMKAIWENRQHVRDEPVEAEVTYPEYAEVTVYRMVEHQRMPFTAQVFWEEAYASQGKLILPNSMWQKRPRGQLGKGVEAAALRMAFPEELGNTYAAEEMEGRTIEGAVVDPVGTIQTPTRPSDILPTPPEDDDPPKGGNGGGAAEQGATAGAASTEPTPTGQLHNSDQPEGGENEVTHPATGEPMTNTRPAPDLESYFARVVDEVGEIEGEDDFLAAWADLKVEEQLAGNDAALDRAEEIRRGQLARIAAAERGDLEAQGQGVLFMPEVPN